MAGGGLNCILDMDVAVTSRVKIKTPHVMHLEENSLIPLCTLPHPLKTRVQYIGNSYRKEIHHS